LDLAGQRRCGPRHPGLGRVHDEPLPQRGGERHRRRLFDLTDGWNGKPAIGEHVLGVTHRAPTDWEHGSGRPFFATGALLEPLLFENPSAVVQGDRVTHLVYNVNR
jgi:hypothetical protein